MPVEDKAGLGRLVMGDTGQVGDVQRDDGEQQRTEEDGEEQAEQGDITDDMPCPAGLFRPWPGLGRPGNVWAGFFG